MLITCLGNTICVCSYENCHFATVDYELFKQHIVSAHPQPIQATTPTPRIPCTFSGCGHTFASVSGEWWSVNLDNENDNEECTFTYYYFYW